MRESDLQKSQELHERRQGKKTDGGSEIDEHHQQRTRAARELKKLENGEFGRKIDIEREER
jgi:hypothetical protein